MVSRRETIKGLSAGVLAAAAGPTFAQDDKSTVTVFVGAASAMDFGARSVAEQLRESLNRPAIAVSRLGAGQRVALGEVKRAAPDGRSLVFVTNGPFAIYPHVYQKLDYDPDRDFTPIIGISKFDVAIATGPQTGATTLKEMIAWAKARKEDTVYASAPGNGSFSHFVGIATSLTTGVPLVHVPYKDSGTGIIDVASGRIPMLITGLSALIAQHQAGKIRLLAISGAERSPLVPDVPTLKEAGVNISRSTTTGVFGPAKMAPELVTRIHDAIVPIFKNEAVMEKMRQAGMTTWRATGAEMAASIREEREYFGKLAKESGYVPTEG